METTLTEKEIRKQEHEKRKSVETSVKEILSSEEITLRNDLAKIKALLIIYQFQTDEEQKRNGTVENNGIGFTAFDGEVLSSMARNLYEYKSLTDNQMKVVRKGIKKYWKQISIIALQGKTFSNIERFIETWKEKNKTRYNQTQIKFS